MQGKVTSNSSAPAVYAGIDVSKDWLDVHMHPAGTRFRVSNDLVGLRRLRQRLDGAVPERIVLEATSKYHRPAHRTLSAWGFAVAVVNPLRSRLFAEASGVLGKTDRVDARVLALMGEALKLAVSTPVSEQLEELAELVNARTAASADAVALGNRLKATESRFLGTELRRQLATLERHLDRLAKRIEHAIAADPQLAARAAILRSIPGIGPLVAAALLAGLSELGTCSGKAASLLVGVAPIADDSGNRHGKRHIRGGRQPVRNALYMAALATIRHNPGLGDFYRRLVQSGKAKKLAITAVIRKLVVLANTLITQNRNWTPKPPMHP